MQNSDNEIQMCHSVLKESKIRDKEDGEMKGS